MNKEPFSAYAHLGGFAVAIVGLVPLVLLSAGHPAKLVGMALFGSTAALLFLLADASMGPPLWGGGGVAGDGLLWKPANA